MPESRQRGSHQDVLPILVSALKFAEALRVAQRLHGDHEGLRDIIAGELQTTNLSYDDYRRAGDHREFLAHFGKHGEIEWLKAELSEPSALYLATCRALDDKTRAMSIFQPRGRAPPDYRYYLERHIELDTREGGHV